MEVTGTAISVRRRKTSYGSLYITVQLARAGTHDIRLTWLHGFEPIPARGQRVAIDGMPLMYGRQRGITPNISVFALTIHYCLADYAGYGACIREPGHGQPHRDAHGREFEIPA